MGNDDIRHFRILEDIANDLSGDVNFPTCLEAAVAVRDALEDPAVSLDKVVQVVGIEPLIATKLLRLANSIAYNFFGEEIADLGSAIGRIGFEAVRITSLAMALEQLSKSSKADAFGTLPRRAWEHSLQVAAIARVLARRLGRVNPEEAMLAGMVHDIGVFYLLYRAADYPEYLNDQDALEELVTGWHKSIGEDLLQLLGLPKAIIEAVADHDCLQDVGEPCTLKDILYFANLLGGGEFPWPAEAMESAEAEDHGSDRTRYADLLAEAEDDIRELRSALAA